MPKEIAAYYDRAHPFTATLEEKHYPADACNKCRYKQGTLYWVFSYIRVAEGGVHICEAAGTGKTRRQAAEELRRFLDKYFPGRWKAI
jgi:hypothetical protein